MDETTVQAKRAAELARSFNKMYTDSDSGFGLVGISSQSKQPQVHVEQATLDAISDREDWTWRRVAKLDGTYMYFQADVDLWGASFMAIFDNRNVDLAEAAAYGCPEEVLNEYTPF